LPTILRDQIAHFFTHYKDLEPRKWVRFKGWVDPEEAVRLVQAATDRAKA
jgi:inorganic pyrophosphatase